MKDKILTELENLKKYQDLLSQANDMDVKMKYFDCSGKLQDRLQEEFERVGAVIDTLETLYGDAYE